MSNLSDLIKAKLKKPHVYYVPEWDLTVLIKGISASARVQISLLPKVDGEPDRVEFLKLILATGLCDPDTKQPIFTMETVASLIEDEDEGIVDRLFIEILKKSKLHKDALEESKTDFFDAQSGDTSTS